MKTFRDATSAPDQEIPYLVVCDSLFFASMPIEDVLVHAEDFAQGDRELFIDYLTAATEGKRLVKKDSKEYSQLIASGCFDLL